MKNEKYLRSHLGLAASVLETLAAEIGLNTKETIMSVAVVKDQQTGEDPVGQVTMQELIDGWKSEAQKKSVDPEMPIDAVREQNALLRNRVEFLDTGIGEMLRALEAVPIKEVQDRVATLRPLINESREEFSKSIELPPESEEPSTNLIEINNGYIAWINSTLLADEPPLTKESLTAYINEVLAKHKASWEELEEGE